MFFNIALVLCSFLLCCHLTSSFEPANQSKCKDCNGILVDTDCGADDAMAISLLLKAEAAGQTSPWGRVQAFTTTTGNTGAFNVSRNVKVLLGVLGRTELPVYRGGEDGLADDVPPTWFYGYDGLGDFLPPAIYQPVLPTDINPASFIASTVHQNPGKITILSIGPLTNLALALRFNDNFFSDVNLIVILGGDYQGNGNMGPGIEANMYSDPDAASFFFSKIPTSASNKVILIPLETIEANNFPMTYRTEILGGYNNSLMAFLNKAERVGFSQYGSTWPCYDPTAASILLSKSLVQTLSPARVEVVTQGPRGAMFASLASSEPNVNIVTKINSHQLKNILEHLLS